MHPNFETTHFGKCDKRKRGSDVSPRPTKPEQPEAALRPDTQTGAAGRKYRPQVAINASHTGPMCHSVHAFPDMSLSSSQDNCADSCVVVVFSSELSFIKTTKAMWPPCPD